MVGQTVPPLMEQIWMDTEEFSFAEGVELIEDEDDEAVHFTPLPANQIASAHGSVRYFVNGKLVFETSQQSQASTISQL